MNHKWEEWRAWIERLPEDTIDFGKWLFVRAASVLFACKAGELIMLGDGQCRMTIGQQMEAIRNISKIWNYSWAALPRHGSRAQVIIYDQTRLRTCLNRTPRWVFDKMGYPPGIGPAEFIEEVGRRWTQKELIPHEVGLALGYPVKDVLGYMGLVPLPCTGKCGWCIHGNPRASLEKSREFRKAREKALAFLSILAGQGNREWVTADGDMEKQTSATKQILETGLIVLLCLLTAPAAWAEDKTTRSTASSEREIHLPPAFPEKCNDVVTKCV